MGGPKKINREIIPGIPERLTELRLTEGLTQGAFAEKIGTTRSTYSKYESGQNTPSSAVIDNISKTYRVSRKWLETGEGDMYTSMDEDDGLARYFADIVSGATTEFERNLILVMSQIPKEHWPVMEDFVRRVAELYKNKKEDQG